MKIKIINKSSEPIKIGPTRVPASGETWVDMGSLPRAKKAAARGELVLLYCPREDCNPVCEPKAEEPKAEEPKAEEPKAEEPKAEEPKAEEPPAPRRRRGRRKKSEISEED